MALERQRTISVEEYFALEESNPETRYEYIDGYVYMMAGGTVNHDTIKSNLERILWNLLRGSKCRTYSSDMRVSVSETRYYHPDVTVSCDQRNRGASKMVQFPRVVVEVLSPSTETTDRREKLKDYLACPTIEEYLLVDAQSLSIEIYQKEGQKWVYEMFKANDEIELTSLGVHFPLTAAYVDVGFEEETFSVEGNIYQGNS
ncbi:MAG TPA: Uma2 family endonuclease [Ktedonobacteraceae bacterium]|nr:Uma2 family endonuclease [Ktedonobacteraceae bacterium]